MAAVPPDAQPSGGRGKIEGPDRCQALPERGLPQAAAVPVTSYCQRKTGTLRLII